MSTKLDKLLIRFERLKEDILMTSEVDLFETPKEKNDRIAELLSSYPKFCMYYFPSYCTSEMAPFHKRLSKKLINNPNRVYLAQIFREGAKTVHGGIMLPLFLMFTGELTGMIVGCANEDDAKAKLSDIQAILQFNQRIINDFGPQIKHGHWETGKFATRKGVFFRAFGKKQSPRGVRFGPNRPNYGFIDDIDTRLSVKNDQLSYENYLWVKEDFMAALSIKKWWCMVAENLFHKNTVTAQFADDPDIDAYVCKVNLLDKNGESSWPERFTTQECKDKIKSIGYISSEREYFNNPVEEGTIFTNEMIHWTKPLRLDKYDFLISYTDPSYKHTDKSDYKATILIGKTKLEYHILKAKIEKVPLRTMFHWMYDYDQLSKLVGAACQHYMESNFLQDLHWRELKELAKDIGFMLPVVGDNRKKPDKFTRVESLSPLFDRAVVKFNIREKEDVGMQRLISQFLAFEKGSRINDDGPDAVEGGIYILNNKSIQSNPPAFGSRKKTKYRY